MKHYGSGDIIRKRRLSELSVLYSYTGLTCSIILPSFIEIFQMVAELYSGNENEVKYGSGDIIRKQRYAEL